MVGHPGEGDEDAGAEPWWALSLKVGAAMTIADLAARLLGLPASDLAVITAAFVAAQPPATSIGTALRRWAAAMLGVALGVAAGWAVRATGAPPPLAPLAIGLVAGALSVRSTDYLHAAVVGIVVSFAVEATDRGVPAIAWEKGLAVSIGCLAAPLVVLAIGRARGLGR